MPDYSYKYPIDTDTRNRLLELNSSEWIGVFERIINNKSIDYNINFSEFDPRVRLCTLYSVLITANIETDGYQQALVNLFYEVYPISQKSSTSFILIQVIDYIRPAKYFQRLSLLVTNSAYKDVIHIKTPNGLLLQLYLINTLMHFDVDSSIYNYLKSLGKRLRNYPEYNQILLRYIYSYREQNELEFSAYLNEIFLWLNDKDINRLVMQTLKEYVSVKHSFNLIYHWLRENMRMLKRLDAKIFDDVINFLRTWIFQNEEKLSRNDCFIEIKSLILKIDYTKEIESFLNSEKSEHGVGSILKIMRVHSFTPSIRRRQAKDLLLEIGTLNSIQNQSEKGITERQIEFAAQISEIREFSQSDFYINVDEK